MAWLITWPTIESDVAKDSECVSAWHIYVVYLIKYIHSFVLLYVTLILSANSFTDAYSLVSTKSIVVRLIRIIINNTTEPRRKNPYLFDIIWFGLLGDF